MMGLLYVPFMLHFLVAILMRDGYATAPRTISRSASGWWRFRNSATSARSSPAWPSASTRWRPTSARRKRGKGAIGGVFVSAGRGPCWLIAGLRLRALSSGAASRRRSAPRLEWAPCPSRSSPIVSRPDRESVLKRRADIKDTGKLIPGIGGAFDLTDSLILTGARWRISCSDPCWGEDGMWPPRHRHPEPCEGPKVVGVSSVPRLGSFARLSVDGINNAREAASMDRLRALLPTASARDLRA